MSTRREFLVGLMAVGMAPAPVWADAGNPSFLSAARMPDGSFGLCGLSADGDILFQLPLPGRGHAAAAHPFRPEAVAFARRPGTFASVINCSTGHEDTRLFAPAGRHFYGHGVFSSDGRLLFTTENDYEAGQGRIGIWDASAGYARTGEFFSGGIGPHDIRRLPDSDTLVVANGGIDTHPDSGRTKLNIPTMRPNLSYYRDQSLIDQAELPPGHHKNSIRHLAVARNGVVAMGMQWQGGAQVPSLVGSHQIGQPIRLMSASPKLHAAMQGYVGSVAITPDGQDIAVTSPRGGQVQVFERVTGLCRAAWRADDVGGIAAVQSGFVATSGTGRFFVPGPSSAVSLRTHPVQWDNHLIAV